MASTLKPIRDVEIEGKISQIQTQSIIFSVVIFSVLVLFALCFIYTMYLCTHWWQNGIMMDQNQNQNQASSAAQNQISLFVAEFNGTLSTGYGLDSAAIDSLPVVSYGTAAANSNMSKEVDCSICLANFDYGEKLKLVPQCCHAFHSECLDKWLIAQSNCPLCRAQVYSARSPQLLLSF